MPDETSLPARPPLAALAVTALAAGFLIAHLAAVSLGAYEFHRDELLYLAMGRHLRLWRMDFPPGIAILAQTLRHTVGDSLVAVHALSALAASLVVVLAALIARELGGGWRAQALAALAIVGNPLFMRAGALYQPVVLDQVAWTLGYLALARWRRTDDPRWWLGVGVAAGLGLLCKFSILFFGFGVFVAVLLLPERRVLLTRWPWLAALVSLGIGAPSLVGQLALDWPVVGQMHDLQSTQLEHTTALGFVGGQLLMGPGVLLAVAGAWAAFAWRPLARWRVVVLAGVVSFLTLLLLHGKSYYAGPVFPAMMAAGAVWLDARVGGARGWRTRAALGGITLLIVAYAVLVLPLGFPFLQPEPMARYAARLGISAAVTTNTGHHLALPQDYADMLGWEAQARTMAGAYNALSPADRARVVIAAGNYGEAGALDYYGPRLGLPTPVSTGGSFWFFGPGERRGDVVLVASGDDDTKADLETEWAHCASAATVDNPWGVDEERHVTIWRCDAPRRSLQALWLSRAGRH